MFKLLEKAISVYRTDEMGGPPASLWPFIWHYTHPFRFLLLGLFCTSAIIAVIEVYMFSVMGQMIDWMELADDPTLFFTEYGGQLIWFGVLIMVIWPLLNFIDSLLEHQGLLGNFSMQIRWRAHRYLLRQSTTFFANDYAGRLATKVMQTALSVRDSVVSLNGLIVYVAVYFASSLVIFFLNDWRLILPLILWLATYALLMRYFLPKLEKVATEQSDARSKMTGRVVDAYTNIQTVKMFSSTDAEENYAKESMNEMLLSVYQQMRLVTKLNTTLIFTNGLLIVGTLGFGVWLWTQSLVSTGAVAVATALTLRLQAMSQWFIWELARLFEAIGTTQDGLNTLSQPLTVIDSAQARELHVNNGAISFKDVSFHYGKDSGVIEGFSLDIKPGERIGLVGHSGAGKSTLVNLLLRLHDVQSGSIEIDGQDVSDVSQQSLRAHIAMVTQDTSLMHRSIRENIAYGKPNATEDEILAAARMAKADEFIDDLEDNEGRRGLNAMVGERGVKLSGGQRQRIAIARVILKNAPILILDEATSALDSEVESAIQEQLNTLMQGKTVVAIAHRLSTIAQLDRLIVLQDGRIVEQGTHQELVASGGVYARLWNHQSGGFL